MKEELTLGQKIKYARRSLGMSQQQLADMIGVSDKTVSSYEVGRAMPPVDTLKEISKVTAKSIAYFVAESGNLTEESVGKKLDSIEKDLQYIKDILSKKFGDN